METENIELGDETCNISVKKPKRVLHFSDGTMEEYSDTDEDLTAPVDKQDQVDTSQMGWGPWMIHKTIQTGYTTLGVCDYVGEALASFLGITTPKYQYELEEYKRLQEERKNVANTNREGWLNSAADKDELSPSVSTEQPSTTVAPTAV